MRTFMDEFDVRRSTSAERNCHGKKEGALVPRHVAAPALRRQVPTAHNILNPSVNRYRRHQSAATIRAFPHIKALDSRAVYASIAPHLLGLVIP